MRIVPRTAYEERLRALLRTFPAVAILGARQSGKSTLARGFVGDLEKGRSRAVVFDLERPADWNRLSGAAAEDLALVQAEARFVCIDEVQRIPALFALLRPLIDDRGRKARYLLLGSASPALVAGVSESLAGRIGFLDLTPFLASEVHAASGGARQRLWVRGGFPPSYLARSERASLDWRNAYVRTFLERDVPALGIRTSAAMLHRFWTMIAHLHGNLLNATELASALGITAPTVVRYLDILEGTFLVRRLRPYWANVGKRLTKAPKVYVRDTGLLHALLGVADASALRSHPKVGASWEGFVIEQLLASLAVAGEAAEGYFWRTHGGAEVDLLVRLRGRILPIEIKMAAEPRPPRSLVECMKDLKATAGFVLHGGDDFYPLGGRTWALPAALLARPEDLCDRLLRPERGTPGA